MVKGQVNDKGNKTRGYIHPVATTTFADNKFQGNVTALSVIVDSAVIL